MTNSNLHIDAESRNAGLRQLHELYDMDCSSELQGSVRNISLGAQTFLMATSRRRIDSGEYSGNKTLKYKPADFKDFQRIPAAARPL
jgi:hypothetical protein